ALTLVSWGSTVRTCERAARALSNAGIMIDLFDLRSISPWDSRSVRESAERTGKLIVVHEDNYTCGFGSEILSSVAEHAASRIEYKRVTRPDTFVPCNFSNQLEILPSFRRVVEACAELLDLRVTWQEPSKSVDGLATVRAIGSSPADESVTVV